LTGDQEAMPGVAAWLTQFAAALDRHDIGAVAGLFHEECFWRDLLSFTWTIATFEGRPSIAAMLQSRLRTTGPARWSVKECAPSSQETEEAWISFETTVGRGQGYVRLRNGKCWTLLTALHQLKGHEERSGRRRPLYGTPATHGIDTVSWLERREKEIRELGHTRQPYVLIVGGSQGGLALGARLKMLGVPTLIVDRGSRCGDQWRSRYSSLSLHDPVWYDHLPYLPFPDTWPVFTPKDKIGDWLEMYARVMELDVWNGAECLAAAYDESKSCWTVEIDRAGQRVTLAPDHLVLATGLAGFPNEPQFANAAAFEGVQYHSSKHPGGNGFAGKKVVVIGSNNSAHDICADLWQHGADVTMVQRSSTHVSRSETLMEVSMAPLYSQQAVDAGMSTDKADLLFASIPLRLLAEFQKRVVAEIARRDAEFYARLEKVGFMHDFGEDGSGLYLKYLRRASGYYVDVGASDLIASGKIKLRSHVEVDRLEPKGVVLSDGAHLPADAIIFATGFGPMSQWVRALISETVAERIGRCWGYGSDTTHDPGPWVGELRNMWKPTAQPGLWFHGGNLQQSRFYSLYLALQLKARFEKLPIAAYAP
jgi:putative flavoprotein involved in K+ transport